LRERLSFQDRANGSSATARSITHHRCISNNVPLRLLVEFLVSVFCTLIIELVPKEDSPVQRLLATTQDIFGSYNSKSFKEVFSEFFDVHDQCSIEASCRTVFAMMLFGLRQ
jgi:hypothetical protein